MIPNFALSLSFDGIRLLRRTGPRWALIDEAAIDGPDLDAAMARLRARAGDLDPRGGQVLLLIPNEQIRFLDLPDLGGDDSGRDAAIRAALDGATPYAVSDLSHDHAVSGGRLLIAAVANETLAEAEGFAETYGFTPVAFAAIAPEGAFDGSVFFGRASSWRRSVDRPSRAIEVVPADEAALTPVAQPAKYPFAQPSAMNAAPAASKADRPDASEPKVEASETRAEASEPKEEAAAVKPVSTESAAAMPPEAKVSKAPEEAPRVARADEAAISKAASEPTPSAKTATPDVSVSGPSTTDASAKLTPDPALSPEAPSEVHMASGPAATDAPTKVSSERAPSTKAEPSAPVARRTAPEPTEKTAANLPAFSDDTSKNGAEPAGTGAAFASAASSASGLPAFSKALDPDPAERAGGKAAEPRDLEPLPDMDPVEDADEAQGSFTFASVRARREEAAPPAPRPLKLGAEAGSSERPRFTPLAAPRGAKAKPIDPPRSGGKSEAVAQRAEPMVSKPVSVDRSATASPAAEPARPEGASARVGPAARPAEPAAPRAGLDTQEANTPPAPRIDRSATDPQLVASRIDRPATDTQRSAPRIERPVEEPQGAAQRIDATSQQPKSPAASSPVQAPRADLRAEDPAPRLGPAASTVDKPAAPAPQVGTAARSAAAAPSAPARGATKADKPDTPRAKSGSRAEPPAMTRGAAAPTRPDAPATDRTNAAAKAWDDATPQDAALAARTATEAPAPNPLARLAALRSQGLSAPARTPAVAAPAMARTAAAAAAIPAAGAGFGGSKQASRSLGPDSGERERMTVFGARNNDRIGGKPRFLGLMLTAALLIFLAGVAAWASVFLDEGLARLFRSPEPETEVASLPAEIDPEPETATPQDTAPQADAAEPVQLTALAPAPEAEPAPAPQRESAFDVEPVAAPADPALSQTTQPRALSPEEADATYAATGIWQRAPAASRTPPPDGVEDVYVASIDPDVESSDAIALPVALSPSDEPLLEEPGLPPPPGMTFDIDDRGLVRATPEGALTPDGLRVYAGLPPVVPPLRSPPEAEPDVSAEPDADADAGAEADVDAPEASPVLEQLEQFRDSRPRARPSDVIEQRERATLQGNTRSELAAFRPVMRPESVQEEAAEAEAAEAAPEEAAPPPPATAQAVQTSLAPVVRPGNFAAIVQRAERTPQPQAQAAPVQTAAVAPRTVSPAVPSSASVARSATVRNAINLGKINLIGVYGTPNNRRALVRLSNGKYQKVQVGDRLDGGRVSAIGDSELRYTKGSRNLTLQMPSG